MERHSISVSVLVCVEQVCATTPPPPFLSISFRPRLYFTHKFQCAFPWRGASSWSLALQIVDTRVYKTFSRAAARREPNTDALPHFYCRAVNLSHKSLRSIEEDLRGGVHLLSLCLAEIIDPRFWLIICKAGADYRQTSSDVSDRARTIDCIRKLDWWPLPLCIPNRKHPLAPRGLLVLGNFGLLCFLYVIHVFLAFFIRRCALMSVEGSGQKVFTGIW